MLRPPPRLLYQVRQNHSAAWKKNPQVSDDDIHKIGIAYNCVLFSKIVFNIEGDVKSDVLIFDWQN